MACEDLWREMMRQMLKIRHFEAQALEQFRRDMVRGSIHVCTGQEAVAVGVCAALRPDDYITSTHRGHGHCLAKGGDVRRMMAELLGRRAGYCQGKGGSMHIAALGLGILGANGIVGGGIPVAVGAALALKMQRLPRVVACFFGDGALNQGSFHEAANLGAIWKLPVVFVCENNQYALSAPVRTTFAIQPLSARAAGYGFAGVTVDGNDPLEVYRVASEAVERARRGEGPTLIEAVTYRFEGHFLGDPCVYRSREEAGEWKKKDPVRRFGQYLVERGCLTAEELAQMEREVEEEVAEAARWAQTRAEPEPADLEADVYAP